MLLLASATLFVRSLNGVLSLTAGVDRQVLVMAADAEAGGYEDERATAYYQQLLERVRNVPGVAAAAISMYPPLSGGDGAWTQNVSIDGAPPVADPAGQVYFNTVSSAYFRTTGMTLLRGRDIADGDNQTTVPVAVVNEVLVRRFFPDRTRSAGKSPSAATRAGRTCRSSASSPMPSISGSRRSRAASRICRGSSSEPRTCSSSCAPDSRQP